MAVVSEAENIKYICNDWRRFIKTAIHQQPSPSFYQWVKRLIAVQFPTPPKDISEHPDRQLNLEEKNALRYVAGHICRKIHIK